VLLHNTKVAIIEKKASRVVQTISSMLSCSKIIIYYIYS